MSKIKNGFQSGSGTCIRCIHSKYGESHPPITPQEERKVDHMVGGTEGYFTLQAIQCDDPRRSKPSSIHSKSAQNPEYEVEWDYNNATNTWTIGAVGGSNSASWDVTLQTHVNIEIGP